MSYEHNGDRIVYTVVTAPGGEDGRDHNDKGGTIVFATFDKEEAQKRAGNDSRLLLSPQVIDVSQLRKAILARLDPIERLVMDKVESGKRRGQ